MLFLKLACALFVVLELRAEPVVLPEAQNLRYPGSGVIKCVFPTPLAECWIRVSEHSGNHFDTLLDFGAGMNAPSVKLNDEFNASYAGNGLDPEGECGVKVDVTSYSVLLVECYGRAVDGQVGRGFGLMSTHNRKHLPVNFESPRLVLTAPGTNVAVLLKADRSLSFCYITTPSAGGLELRPGETPRTGRRYQHHGTGRENKQCGVILAGVQANDSGVWSTWAYSGANLDYAAGQATVAIVQASPMGYPVLEIKDKDSLKAGQVLVAKCIVPSAVPHCNITWLIGGQVVRQDNLNDTLPGDVGKTLPWQPQPLHQTFRRLLTAQDSGKRLECRMDHLALAGPRTVGQELPVSASSTPSPAPVASCNVPSPVAPSLTESCGLAVAGRVGVNQEAVEGQFPWHAAVYATYSTGLEPLCAATLISRRHLLTAAHCVCAINSSRALEASTLSVTLGTTVRASANESTTHLLAVESVHTNRWYRGRYTFTADLAVLRLREEVHESATVRRACVDWHNRTEQQDLREERAAQMATWGAVNQSSLSWLELKYANESACLKKLDEDNLAFRYSHDTVCAKHWEERNHCEEDAGAGLMFVDATSQRHYVRGVASLPFTLHRYDRGCSFRDSFTGFTRLSAHIQWLEAIVLAG